MDYGGKRGVGVTGRYGIGGLTPQEIDALVDRVSSGYEASDDREFWDGLLRKVERCQKRARAIEKMRADQRPDRGGAR